MAFCEECGKKLPENAKNCPNCGAVVEREKQVNEEKGTVPDIAEKENMQFAVQTTFPAQQVSMPYANSFILAENEKIVRQYECSSMKGFLHWISFFNCEGYLTVTNQRIIFRGKGWLRSMAKEISLDSVYGFDSFNGIKINFISFLLGLLLVCNSITADRMSMLGRIPTLLFIIEFLIGAFLIANSIKKSFFFSLSSKIGGISPFSWGHSVFQLFRSDNTRSAPGPDAEAMIIEIGALIRDLQTMGDEAIKKWNRQ